jgi:hypothetical protein
LGRKAAVAASIVRDVDSIFAKRAELTVEIQANIEAGWPRIASVSPLGEVGHRRNAANGDVINARRQAQIILAIA